MHRLVACLALVAALLAGPVTAFEDPERTWSHKAWHVAFTAGACSLWTGSDGSGTFELTFGRGGVDGAAHYLPIVYSNLPLPLREEDGYEILIDGQPSGFGPEMWFYDGPDAYGRYMVGAALTGGFVPDLVEAFRQGNALAIRVTPMGKAAYVADAFSLAGFSAAYLKASEWCQFDPDALLRS